MNAQSPKVVVVGSLNMDLVIKAEQQPQTGETVLGDEFGMFTGGKGFNQAIAAARSGAEVAMVGRLGRDLFGDELMSVLTADKIDGRFVVRDAEVGTGIASISIGPEGDNRIVVVPRANMRLTVEDVERSSSCIAAADILLLQLEVPIEASQNAAEIARANGTLVILDPAPAQDLPDSFIGLADILTPNELETESLSGVNVSDQRGVEQAAQIIFDKGVPTVVLTLGDRGALLLTADLKKNSARLPC
jgi:ribokinase